MSKTVWALGQPATIGFVTHEVATEANAHFTENPNELCEYLLSKQTRHTTPKLAIKTQSEIVTLPDWATLPYEIPIAKHKPTRCITAQHMKELLEELSETTQKCNCIQFAILLMTNLAMASRGLPLIRHIDNTSTKTTMDMTCLMTLLLGRYGIPIFTAATETMTLDELLCAIDNGLVIALPLKKGAKLKYLPNTLVTTDKRHIVTISKLNDVYKLIDNNGVTNLSKMALKELIYESMSNKEIVIGVDATMSPLPQMSRTIYENIKEDEPNTTVYNPYKDEFYSEAKLKDLEPMRETSDITIDIRPTEPPIDLIFYLNENTSRLSDPTTFITATPNDNHLASIQLQKEQDPFEFELQRAKPTEVFTELMSDNRSTEIDDELFL